MEYTKRYTAAFIHVLSTPFSVKMVHQDGIFSIVNNKQVKYLYPPISLLAQGAGKTGKRQSQIALYSFVNLCISFLEKIN